MVRTLVVNQEITCYFCGKSPTYGFQGTMGEITPLCHNHLALVKDNNI